MTRQFGRARAVAACALVALAALAVTGLGDRTATDRALAAPAGTPTPARTEEASLESTETTPLPAEMAWVGDSRQLVVVTADGLGETTGTVRVFEQRDGAWVELLEVPAWLGRRGMRDGAHRVQGDQTTPTGIWRMPDFVFGAHPSPPSGTKMRYRHITMRTWWSGRRDKTFNSWVVRKGRWHGEHLADSKRSYEFAISTGFNARPNHVRMSRGCAIFLHVHAHPGGTAGCVAVSRADMIRIVRLLDPAKLPRFASGTTVSGSATSIWAY